MGSVIVLPEYTEATSILQEWRKPTGVLTPKARTFFDAR